MQLAWPGESAPRRNWIMRLSSRVAFQIRRGNSSTPVDSSTKANSKTISLSGVATIVYVPMTEFGTSERYLEYAMKVLQPILATESVIVLGGSAINTLQGKTTTSTSVNLNP
jgi:hypothetical protein